MRIDAYIDNPVISNQQEYYELLELLEEIDPQCNSGTTPAGGCNY